MTAGTRLQAFLEQFESTLSDALTRMEATDEDGKAATGELATQLSQIGETLQHMKPADLAGLAAAVRELRLSPVINNEVHVAPAEVRFLPAPTSDRVVTYEVLIPGRFGASDQRMTITRTERTVPP
jgi:hypothetical protein